MPATYEAAEASVIVFAKRVMHKYHGPLHDLETTVEILMASPPLDKNGDVTGPALKLHGVKCAATIRQTRPDERALGNSDLHLKLDKDTWDESDEEQREAIIDHELSHFVPRLEKKTGLVKRDNFDRPLFAAVNHDWQVGWFFSVARRHGLKSIECRQLQEFLESDNYRDCFRSTKAK